VVEVIDIESESAADAPEDPEEQIPVMQFEDDCDTEAFDEGFIVRNRCVDSKERSVL